MDLMTIVAIVGAAVFGGLWLAKRRARLRSEHFE
jgi:hypothetical protein